MSPLDLLMPGANIGAVLIFPTTLPHSNILTRLQAGLDKVCERIPWLNGCVTPTDIADGTAPGLEVRWAPADPAPRIIDKATLPEVSYGDLAGAGMPLEGIPSAAWPMANAVQAGPGGEGAPAFAASVFGFAHGEAVGLCVQAHHNTTDGFGFAAIIRLWGELMKDEGAAVSSFQSASGRIARLDAVLPTLATSVADLWAKHPEPSATDNRSAVDHAVACALVWSAITRARAQRLPVPTGQTSRLPMAVNGRKRLDPALADPNDPYLGNAVLFALAEAPVTDLQAFAVDGAAEPLADIVSAVSAALAPDRVDAAHVAGVCALVRGVGDHRRIFPGWELFGARDVFVTSWAGLDLYKCAFGDGLGCPRFVRIPYVQAEGNVIVLPRSKRGDADEKLEMVVMSRKDDLEVLRADPILEGLGKKGYPAWMHDRCMKLQFLHPCAVKSNSP